MIIYKIFVCKSLFIFIGEGRHIVFKIEKIIGVVIDICFGSSCKTYQQGIKILENGAIFLEDAAMRFIDDNEVEMGGSEEFLPVCGFHVINGVHDGGVGGENRPISGLIIATL